jgi:hypothetical protein
MENNNWKDKRIHKINASGATYSPNSKYFDEVYAIYESKAKTYKQFKREFLKNANKK